ncbi:MAG: hemerythrin domain-containing protein [Motilibacteraceae bacterium]
MLGEPVRDDTTCEVPAPAAAVGVTPTPAPERLTDHDLWDESARPQAPAPPAAHRYHPQGPAVGAHLVDVHDHLRAELTQLRDVVRQVEQGRASAGEAREVLQELTLKQNAWALGAYCASYCRLLTQHHTLEDRAIFPHLRAAEPGLAPVVDRLEEEHVVIHGVVEQVDRALVAAVTSGELAPVRAAVDLLTDTLLSHLSYEEHQLVEPLARHGMYAGQL